MVLFRSALYPEVLGTLGNWSSELKSESTSTILESYLEKSVQSFEKSRDHRADKVVDAYVSLAGFCDGQFKQISEYMRSKDFEDKTELMNKLQDETTNM
jgi:hypothetical protein